MATFTVVAARGLVIGGMGDPAWIIVHTFRIGPYAGDIFAPRLQEREKKQCQATLGGRSRNGGASLISATDSLTIDTRRD